MRTVRILVSGRVQGVGFRAFAVREAERIGIHGWVRNLPDGRVEALARGEPASLEAFLSALRRGPPSALVTGLALEDRPDAPVQGGFFQRDG